MISNDKFDRHDSLTSKVIFLLKFLFEEFSNFNYTDLQELLFNLNR